MDELYLTLSVLKSLYSRTILMDLDTKTEKSSQPHRDTLQMIKTHLKITKKNILSTGTQYFQELVKLFLMNRKK